MIVFSIRERFIGSPNPVNGGFYAPVTIGCPEFTHPVDYQIFKQTKDQKIAAKVAKANHKKLLEDFYGKGKVGKRLNISVGS